MQELIEWIMENWGKPLKASSFIILALILIDKIGLTLLSMHEQRRVEAKLDALLERTGTVWKEDGALKTGATGRTSLRKLSLLSLGMPFFVLVARKYIHWRKSKMININKGILLPLLSAIALFVKEAFGYEIPGEYIDMAANIILYLIMFAGIFVHPKKEKRPSLTDME